MATQQIIDLFDQHVIPNYTRSPIVFVKGEGSRLTDSEGKTYLDLFSGWAVTSVGHCHPALVRAIQDQAAKLIYMPNIFYWEQQGRLAEKIAAATGWHGQSFFCNSGAESVEGALKLARLAAGGRRHKVIAFENSFHGRTLATLAATGQPKGHKGFDPLLPWFRHARLNDLESVRALVDDETAAILVEPIQGEGGVNPCSDEFLPELRALADEHGLLLIFDEVWTGVGRTGRWFCHQHYGVTPDIMTMAKSLGGGAVIGAVTARPEVAAALVPGTHASTFGGSPLACAAALAVFETIEREGLVEDSARQGQRFTERLEAMKARHPSIREVRGKGLMIGVELDRPGANLVSAALELGLLINCAHESVIRFAPPLNVSAEVVDEGLDLFEKALVCFEN